MTQLQKSEWRRMLAKSFSPRQWFDGEAGGAEGLAMWVYFSRPGEYGRDVWVVGYWTPEKEWVQDSIHDNRGSAARRVHWLNGGE